MKSYLIGERHHHAMPKINATMQPSARRVAISNRNLVPPLGSPNAMLKFSFF